MLMTGYIMDGSGVPDYLQKLLKRYNDCVISKCPSSYLDPSDTIGFECTWNHHLIKNCAIFNSHNDPERFIFISKGWPIPDDFMIALNILKIIFDIWIDDVMNLPDNFINLLLEVIFISKRCERSRSEIFKAIEKCFSDNHNKAAIEYISNIEFSKTRSEYKNNCIKLFRCLIDEFGENYEYSRWFEDALSSIDEITFWNKKIMSVFNPLFYQTFISDSSNEKIILIDETDW